MKHVLLPGENPIRLGQHLAWHGDRATIKGCVYCARAASEIPRCQIQARLEENGIIWQCSLALGHAAIIDDLDYGHEYTTPVAEEKA